MSDMTQLSEVDTCIVDLVNLLEQINTEAPLAKLNETSINDNNGGRIFL